MKQLMLMLVVVIFAVGCGKSVDHSQSEKAVSKANAMLDSGDYEAAIKILEPLHLSKVSDQEVSTKLLHAYAGAGSFEALKVVSIWKEIEKELDALKDRKGKEALNNILNDVERILAPIPDLTEKQKMRLAQAIDLYRALGMTVETAGQYNNFKWAVLHVYRLATTLKATVKDLKASQVGSESIDLKQAERVIIPNLKIIGQDLFMAYKLYGHSFEKAKKITESVDKIIAKTIGDENFKLKVNVLARDEADFFKSLINDNIYASSILLRKLGDIYQNNGHKDKVKSLVAKLPTEAELKESQKRIETLLKLFIQQFNEDHPEIENKLKSIFTEQLKAEVIEAAKISIKEKNTDALKELLDAKRPEVEVIISCYLVLKGEYEGSEFEAGVREEVEALKKKVDLEMLKTELSQILIDLKEDSRIVEEGFKAIASKNKDALRAHKIEVERKISELQSDLEDVEGDVEELRSTLSSPDQDRDEQDKAVEEVNDLVLND